MQKKRALQTNVWNEYRFKNSQQNTGKPNSTTHQKEHTPKPSQFHSRDFQHMKFYKCNTACKQKQR
jgi:hypothetical protein